MPHLHEDFASRMGGGGGAGKGKQLAVHLEVLLVDEVRGYPLHGPRIHLSPLPSASRRPALCASQVSMLSAEFLDLLDEQMRRLVSRFGHGPANTHRGEKPHDVPPFGGVQLICCGDFFQLPPISSRVPAETWRRLDASALHAQRAVLRSGLDNHESELFLNRGFAFQSTAWWRASPILIELSKVGAACERASPALRILSPNASHRPPPLPPLLSQVWRQKDARLVATLNRVRKGAMTPDDIRYLNSHCATAAKPAAAASHAVGGGRGGAHNSGNHGGVGGSLARPMLLAPVNSVVNDRNARELEEVMARNAVRATTLTDLARISTLPNIG